MPSRYEKYATHHTSRRLDGWDYTESAVYFVTICAYERQCLFGAVRDGRMALTPVGRIVVEEWRRSETIRDEVTLDAFVVMPNHMHGIVRMASDPPTPGGFRDEPVDPNEASHGRATLHGGGDPPTLHRPPRSLGSFIAGFKSVVTRRINRHRGTPGGVVWQRNYHERIIRSARHLHAARRYIRDNPAKWHADRLRRGG